MIRWLLGARDELARTWWHAPVALAALAGVTALYRFLGVTNSTTVALSFLLIILVVATRGRLAAAIVASIGAMLLFNFYFLPPVGTLTIADPQNWVALVVFLAVGIVASNLAATARARALEAISRRDEQARLFDLSRDILLSTESDEAVSVPARSIARRFRLDTVTVCLPHASGGWRIVEGGPVPSRIEAAELDRLLAASGGRIEFDARLRSYSGHHTLPIADGREVHVVPLRFGARPIGILLLAGSPLEAGTMDALAGLVAMAVERSSFLSERKSAELVRQRADLASALLGSLSHDLRSPLTAIKAAVENIQDPALDPEIRREQAAIALDETQRLTRVVGSVLDMARIDAAAVPVQREWVTPADVVDAAVAQVSHLLRRHTLRVDADTTREAHVDPRITSSALAHVLDNAARYSTEGSTIAVHAATDGSETRFSVTDEGPGIDQADLPHLFERFYRGSSGKPRAAGLGMGLAISRGLLAVEGGRLWAENVGSGGARFTLAIPAETRAPVATETEV
jgi:two-component system sensor histidine kinase KdpD